MPATEHPAFKQPATLSSKIWRYQKIVHFIELLRHNSLWFSRIDKLGDPFEGAYPIPIASDQLATHLKNIPQKFVDFQRDLWKLWRDGMLRTNHACCWHRSDCESEAMWKLYSHQNMGLAIVATYSNIFHHLPEDVYIGEVSYINYNTDHFDPHQLFNALMHKRRSFSYEQEIRIVKPFRCEEGESGPTGLNLPIDLSQIIDEVVVSPLAPEWFIDLIRDLLNRYGFSIPVRPSEMSVVPQY